MIFPIVALLATLAAIQAAPTTCPAVDGQKSVYIPDSDCTKFWQCSNGRPYLFDCPAGLHFNPALNVCDWPERAGCNGAPSASGSDEGSSGSSKSSSSDSSDSSDSSASKDSSDSSKSGESSESSDNNGSCGNLSGKCPRVDGPNSVYIPLRDCTKFCQCSNGVAIQQLCPVGLEFNPIKNVCDWPQDAGCKK